MRHFREDHTFVYYYSVSRITGDSAGLRFSRGTVASIRGRGLDPEMFTVGTIHNLPVGPDEATGELYDAIGEVVDTHPEVTDMLSGRTPVSTVFNSA